VLANKFCSHTPQEPRSIVHLQKKKYETTSCPQEIDTCFVQWQNDCLLKTELSKTAFLCQGNVSSLKFLQHVRK